MKNFIEDPKPIVWPDGRYQFMPEYGEKESLILCYLDLMETRSKLYENLQTITVKPERLRHVETAREFMLQVAFAKVEQEIIEARLEREKELTLAQHYSYGKER